MRGKIKKPVVMEDEEEVPIPKRLDCVWDVLDRTGNRAPSKSIAVKASLQDLLIEAHRRRTGQDGEGTVNRSSGVLPEPSSRSVQGSH